MKKVPPDSPRDIEASAAPLTLCTCFKLRRLTRRATQIYDRHLESVGLRATQFSLLGQVYAAGGLAMGALAERMGMDASTLTRNLRPLEKAGLVRIAPSQEDRRVRAVAVTAKGRETFRRAAPKWRAAQEEVDARLGFETRVALNGLLDLSAARLGS